MDTILCSFRGMNQAINVMNPEQLLGIVPMNIFQIPPDQHLFIVLR
jgi:hypothetical protein